MNNYQVTFPVLLLIFNRPAYTEQVFEQIRKVRPGKLYVAADGPRPQVAGDRENCERARAVLNQIDWNCTLKTLYRSENLGCKVSVSSALTWFFENEEAGIILEDDCLPNQSFFRFCDAMLERYQYDQRIGSITGSNHHDKKVWGEASYYFSKRSDIWGWATWRRTWQKYNVGLADYSVELATEQLSKVFSDELLLKQWLAIFNQLKQNRIDTWDYQFHFLNFMEHTLCVVPNKNLISNIGFGPDATHTLDPDSMLANVPTQELGVISHPLTFVPETAADQQVFDREFELSKKRAQLKKEQRLHKKVKRWIRSLLTGNRPGSNDGPQPQNKIS